jgi:hypothetical protein
MYVYLCTCLFTLSKVKVSPVSPIIILISVIIICEKGKKEEEEEEEA